MNNVIIFSRALSSHMEVPSFKSNSFMEASSFIEFFYRNTLTQASTTCLMAIAKEGTKSSPVAKAKKWTVAVLKFSKLRIVYCSTLASETLALSDGYDTAFLIQGLERE